MESVYENGKYPQTCTTAKFSGYKQANAEREAQTPSLRFVVDLLYKNRINGVWAFERCDLGL